MISKMIRYDIVLYAGEQERFINELRELGLVDITTTGWEPTEDDRAILLSIDVNIEIEQMLDTAWTLFANYFSKGEVSIKQELSEKYWKA